MGVSEENKSPCTCDISSKHFSFQSTEQLMDTLISLVKLKFKYDISIIKTNISKSVIAKPISKMSIIRNVCMKTGLVLNIFEKENCKNLKQMPYEKKKQDMRS